MKSSKILTPCRYRDLKKGKTLRVFNDHRNIEDLLDAKTPLKKLFQYVTLFKRNKILVHDLFDNNNYFLKLEKKYKKGEHVFWKPAITFKDNDLVGWRGGFYF